jgi:type II secretory pathway component PulM
VVTRTAQARGLAIVRMSPVEGGLSVRLERADPALLYAWLAELESAHRIPVERASIRVNDAADATVQADIVLAAGAVP